MSEKFIFTKHALSRGSERAADKAEVEYAVKNPKIVLPGKNPGTVRIIADMPFGRKLSVVYKRIPRNTVVVITAFWVEGQP